MRASRPADGRNAHRTADAPDLTSDPTDNLTPGLTGEQMLTALRASMSRPRPTPADDRHDCDTEACPYWCERDD